MIKNYKEFLDEDMMNEGIKKWIAMIPLLISLGYLSPTEAQNIKPQEIEKIVYQHPEVLDSNIVKSKIKDLEDKKKKNLEEEKNRKIRLEEIE